jgi:hypothetical protein
MAIIFISELSQTQTQHKVQGMNFLNITGEESWMTVGLLSPSKDM